MSVDCGHNKPSVNLAEGQLSVYASVSPLPLFPPFPKQGLEKGKNRQGEVTHFGERFSVNYVR